MKKLLSIATMVSATLFFAACGNNSGTEGTHTDTSANVIPPPDNSAATNPSIADTAYSGDTTKMKRDTSKMKQ